MVKHKENIIPNKQFASLMAEVLKTGKAFRFQASGFSMDPFIKDGDILTLVSLTHRLYKIGNVLAFNHPHTNNLTVHRVVARNLKTYLMKPDNGLRTDGWIKHKEVIGMVRSVERGGTMIKFGLGWEKWLIAHLSRRNMLTPTIRTLWRFIPKFIKLKINGK